MRKSLMNSKEKSSKSKLEQSSSNFNRENNYSQSNLLRNVQNMYAHRQPSYERIKTNPSNTKIRKNSSCLQTKPQKINMNKMNIPNYSSLYKSVKLKTNNIEEDDLMNHFQQKRNKIISPHINTEMRTILISWVIQLHHRLKLSHQSLFHATCIIDVILQRYEKITPYNFQLIGVAALFISSKYQQVYPPQADLFCEATAFTFTKQQIISMEATILSLVNFNLCFPTRFRIAQLQVPCQSRKRHLVMMLLQISLLSIWQKDIQKDIAAAAIFLSSKVLGQKVSGSKKTMQITWKLMKLWKQHEKGHIAFFYDIDKYSFVGGIKLSF